MNNDVPLTNALALVRLILDTRISGVFIRNLYKHTVYVVVVCWLCCMIAFVVTIRLSTSTRFIGKLLALVKLSL